MGEEAQGGQVRGPRSPPPEPPKPTEPDLAPSAWAACHVRLVGEGGRGRNRSTSAILPTCSGDRATRTSWASARALNWAIASPSARPSRMRWAGRGLRACRLLLPTVSSARPGGGSGCASDGHRGVSAAAIDARRAALRPEAGMHVQFDHGGPFRLARPGAARSFANGVPTWCSSTKRTGTRNCRKAT